jgi:outer membrane receptor protein involved in Fe transport
VAQPFPLVVYATGNENLKEESLTAYEIGYTGTFNGKTTVGIAAYINDTDDNINFTSLPNNFDPYTPTNPPPGWNQRFGPLGPTVLGLMAQAGFYLPRTAFTYKNLGPIRNKGVELSLEHSFGEVSAFANYSYQAKPKVLDAKSDQEPYPPNELAFPPKNRFNLGLSYNGSAQGNVTLNYSDRAFWSDVLTSAYAGYTDAFNLVNATIGAKWANGKVTTSIKSTNVLNETIQQHVFGDILLRTIVGEVRFQF